MGVGAGVQLGVGIWDGVRAMDLLGHPQVEDPDPHPHPNPSPWPSSAPSSTSYSAPSPSPSARFTRSSTFGSLLIPPGCTLLRTRRRCSVSHALSLTSRRPSRPPTPSTFAAQRALFHHAIRIYMCIQMCVLPLVRCRLSCSAPLCAPLVSTLSCRASSDRSEVPGVEPSLGGSTPASAGQSASRRQRRRLDLVAQLFMRRPRERSYLELNSFGSPQPQPRP